MDRDSTAWAKTGARDAGVEDGASASRGDPGLRMDALRCGAGILKIDILRRDLYVAHGGFDVGMPHQLHECGQAHPGTDHIGSEGVPEAMWVGQLDAAWCGDDSGTGNVSPAGVMRVPRPGPFNTTNRAAEQGSGRSTRR